MPLSEFPLLAELLSFWALLLGLLVGSFLNVVIYRLPLGRSIVTPPSACTTCNTPLRWSHNLPCLSYISQRGTCAYCGSPFSVRYAALELLTGLAFFYLASRFGLLSPIFWKSACLFALCLVVFFIDYDHWIIPDSVNLFGVLTGLGFSALVPITVSPLLRELTGWELPAPAWSLLGVLFGLAFFWSIQVIGLMLAKQEAMGGGDVKFAALLGAYLGPTEALWAFLGSFFLGALFALPMMLRRKGGGKDPIPFGTFMAVAALAVYLFGSETFLAPLETWLLLPYSTPYGY